MTNWDVTSEMGENLLSLFDWLLDMLNLAGFKSRFKFWLMFIGTLVIRSIGAIIDIVAVIYSNTCSL